MEREKETYKLLHVVEQTWILLNRLCNCCSGSDTLNFEPRNQTSYASLHQLRGRFLNHVFE